MFTLAFYKLLHALYSVLRRWQLSWRDELSMDGDTGDCCVMQVINTCRLTEEIIDTDTPAKGKRKAMACDTSY